MPEGATALDFAFHIHTEIGLHAIGAKVNGKMVPLNYQLKQGDQVMIITSHKQKPSRDWLNMVITSKAKQRIRSFLRQEQLRYKEEGEKIIKEKFEETGLIYNSKNISRLCRILKLTGEELFYKVVTEPKILSILSAVKISAGHIVIEKQKSTEKEGPLKDVKNVRSLAPHIIIENGLSDINYEFSKCCSPIPGDDVFGYVKSGKTIAIHRVNCPNAEYYIVHHPERIIRARWSNQTEGFFPAEIEITGIDRIGIVQEITRIISTDMRINMKSIKFEIVEEGKFKGKIALFIRDILHLKEVMDKIKEVKNVESVRRTL